MGAVHMAVVIVTMIMLMLMLMIVVAVRAMDVRLLGHARLLRKVFARNYLAIARRVHAAAEE